MTLRILARTWLGALLGCLPILALLLVPSLMRSRAGSEQLLLVGVVLLFALLTAAFLLAPLLSAWLTPLHGRWEARTAWAATGEVWRRRTGSALLALGAALGVYAAGQAAGYGLGELVPYVRENPARLTDATQSPWIIDYPAYALQAAVLYVATALAVAVYATWIRALRLQIADQAVSSATTSTAATAR